MALNPEWNLEDTVRQIPTVIFSSSSESEGTVRVKKEPEKVLKKESPPVSIRSSSTSSAEDIIPPPSPKKVAPAAAVTVAAKPVRAGSPIRPTSNNDAPVSEISKSKRIYSTVGRILGDMKEQNQYQNSVCILNRLN